MSSDDAGILKFSTIFNVRDLGGYVTPYGSTRTGRFLRSGDTMFLSDGDREALLAYGVRRVVDLRMGAERPELTDRFAGLEGVAWMNASMADDRTMTPEWTKSGRVVEFVVKGYRRMLADHAGIRRIMSFMAAAAPNECVLFHCAGGMDRTGIVSMLVLGNAGVAREDIVTDYASAFDAYEVVRPLVASWDASTPVPTHDGTQARVCAMFRLYDGIVAEYGSVRHYLSSCGISDHELDMLRSHLLCNSVIPLSSSGGTERRSHPE